MSIIVAEKWFSRFREETRTSIQTERHYVAKGSTDETAIRDAVIAESPTTLESGTLSRAGVDVEPVGVEGNGDEPNVWDAIVKYASQAIAFLNGDGDYWFETGGGTRHLEQSIQTVAAYGANADPADNGGLIGATADGVEGVDIVMPVYNFTETHVFPVNAITTGYKNTLFVMTGRVNNGLFRGIAAGACLFLGASGRRISDDFYEITFKFAASPNAENLTVGDITGIDKKGWDYLWVRKVPVGLPDLGVVTQRPVAVYVEQVYLDGNFASLNIGT